MSQGPYSEYPDQPEEQPRQSNKELQPQQEPNQPPNEGSGSHQQPEGQTPYRSTSYQGPGGYDQPQDRTSYQGSGGYNQPPDQNQYKPTSYQGSQGYQQPPSQGAYGATPPYGSPPPNGVQPPQGAPPPYGTPPPYGAPPPYGTPPPYGAPPSYGTPPGYDSYGRDANPTFRSVSPVSSAVQQLPDQYIRVTTKPGVETFAAEQEKANWQMVWVQLIIAAVVLALLRFFYILVFRPIDPTGNTDPFSPAYQSVSPSSALSVLISFPIGTFIDVGIVFLLAKAFGGRGTFLTQMYTSLLWIVPLSIVGGILGFIPILGGIIGLALAIYGIFLNILNVRAVHHLSGGKAAMSVLLPIIAIVVLVLSCGLMLGFMYATQYQR